jgi:hypothetical protein
MKTILMSMAAVVLATSTSMAVDFQSIIVENSKAQNELHDQIQKSVLDSKVAAESLKGSRYNYIADGKESVFIKTSKDILTYEKEKRYYKPSGKQAIKRLAEEFKEIE